MKKYKRSILIMVLVMVFSVGRNVYAIDDITSRETIRGIKKLHVIVDMQPFFLENEGLSKSKIKKDVELKLRLEEIRVLTEEEFKKEKRRPLLYININGMKGSGGLLLYEVAVQLMQDVSLERRPSLKLLAPTWEVGSMGLGETKEIRKSIKDNVDAFIDVYLSVNPKT